MDAQTKSRFGDILIATLTAKVIMIEAGTSETTLECPACGADMRFSLAKGNQHVRGACTKCDVRAIE